MTIPLITIFALFAVAASSGLIGSFALMRRMTLASDAMSHIALPGLAIALMFHVNPFFGGLAALIFGSLLIWGLEQKTKIATETVIGVVFSASLAIGSLLIGADHELLEALFGNISSITNTEAFIGLAGAAAIFGIILAIKDKLILSIFSPDIARTAGISNSKLSLAFLLLFAVNIILGLKFLGVLLMGSLVIIPAATAKNLSRNLTSDLVTAVLAALISTAGGLLLATHHNLDLGPSIIVVSAGLFFVSIFFAKNK